MKLTIAFGLAAVVAVAGCGGNTTNDAADSLRASPSGAPESTRTASGSASDVAAVKQYTFHGKVKAIDLSGQTITVDHEKIDGYMDAMTMPYKVADPSILDQVKVGDETHFTIRVAGDNALITKVQTKHDKGQEH